MQSLMLEREFAKKITRGLEAVGCWCFNVHGHRFQKSGVPDLYVAHPRWTGWIEFKVGEGKPSDLQIMKIKDLLIRGVPAFVVRWREDMVYCELWYGTECETLAYSGLRDKGTTLGMNLLDMFDKAGKNAIEIVKGGA